MFNPENQYLNPTAEIAHPKRFSCGANHRDFSHKSGWTFRRVRVLAYQIWMRHHGTIGQPPAVGDAFWGKNPNTNWLKHVETLGFTEFRGCLVWCFRINQVCRDSDAKVTCWKSSQISFCSENHSKHILSGNHHHQHISHVYPLIKTYHHVSNITSSTFYIILSLIATYRSTKVSNQRLTQIIWRFPKTGGYPKSSI